jgi:lipase maturation factor 1
MPPLHLDEKPSYFFSRWFFLKVLALAYLAAFGSLWFQVNGLIGTEGILPAGFFLKAVQAQVGPGAFWDAPSLCWINSGNGFLQFLCGAGVALSVLLFLGFAPVLCLALLWVFYLSLVSVGQDFLSFQWDNLLLEAGLLAVFAAPLQWRMGRDNRLPPHQLILVLFQWLLFRLMFASGMVKLTSGDPNWRNLTALEYHYWTQPLPTPFAWFLNQLPDWFQKFSCFYMFGVELIAPFLIFGPRKLRPWAFRAFVSLQVLILLAGNYCFFNFLTLGLCFFALEDSVWPGWFKRWWESQPPGKEKKSPRQWPSWAIIPFTAIAIYITGLQMTYTIGLRIPWPGWITAPYQALDPLRSFNSYGLFAVMTTSRPEITVEGSDDAVHWKAYGFKWKAGDLGRAPRFVAPYQPRLDWQMWFAALENPRENPWFLSFLVKLLQGSPDVLGLLQENPFPDKPPKFIRSEVYNYQFTNFAEKARTGNWWKSEYQGPYTRPFSLDQVRYRAGDRN